MRLILILLAFLFVTPQAKASDDGHFNFTPHILLGVGLDAFLDKNFYATAKLTALNYEMGDGMGASFLGVGGALTSEKTRFVVSPVTFRRNNFIVSIDIGDGIKGISVGVGF